jgi:hypothetical protein
MAIEPATLQSFKRAKDIADKIKVTRPIIEKRLRELSDKLAKAGDASDQENIKLYLKALNGEKHLLTTAMDQVQMGIDNVKAVEDDEEFLNTRLKELETVSGPLIEAKTMFTRLYANAMALEKMVKEQLDKAVDANADLTDKLASLDKKIADLEKRATPAAKKAGLIQHYAEDAVQNHDAKELQKQQSDLDALDLPGIVSDTGSVKEDYDWAVKAVKDASVSKGQLKDLLDDLKDFSDRLKELGSTADDLGRIEKVVSALKMDKVDVSKAAKVLSIEKKGEAQLAKVLSGPSDKWAAGLDGLAKQLGISAKGKDMVQKLGKAGIA